MTRTEKQLIYIFLFLSFISGVTIYLLDNFFAIERPWGVEANPYLSLTKAFHYLSTPSLILALGFILKNHIMKKVSNFSKERRKSTGLAITILMIILIFSGQSLLFITNPLIKNITIYTHLVAGVLTSVIIIIHSKRKV